MEKNKNEKCWVVGIGRCSVNKWSEFGINAKFRLDEKWKEKKGKERLVGVTENGRNRWKRNETERSGQRRASESSRPNESDVVAVVVVFVVVVVVVVAARAFPFFSSLIKAALVFGLVFLFFDVSITVRLEMVSKSIFQQLFSILQQFCCD